MSGKRHCLPYCSTARANNIKRAKPYGFSLASYLIIFDLLYVLSTGGRKVVVFALPVSPHSNNKTTALSTYRVVAAAGGKKLIFERRN